MSSDATHENINGPVARAKAAIDDNDNVDDLSRISDLQSWCSLSVDTTIYFFGRAYKSPTIVQYAAYRKCPKCLMYILRRCPNVLDTQSDVPLQNAQIALPYPYPLLHIAVLAGDVRCVQAVIRFSTLGEENLNFINRQDNLGFTALHFVALNNRGAPKPKQQQNQEAAEPENEEINHPNLEDDVRIEIADLLLKNGADLFIPNCMSETPIITALMRCSPLFSHYVDYLMNHNQKDVLDKLLNERKKEYGTSDGEPKTLLMCLRGNPNAYSSLKKLEERIRPAENVPVEEPLRPGDIQKDSNGVIVDHQKIVKCAKQACVVSKDLQKCPHCGESYCSNHYDYHCETCKTKHSK